MHRAQRMLLLKGVSEVFLSIILISGCFVVLAAQASTHSGGVLEVEFDVPVDAGSSSMMTRAVSIAVSGGYKAIIIVMNTPGGLLSDMLTIVHDIGNANESGIPTYTYVVPDGLGASAGSYIAMATNKIFMGPGSELGPSTPIVEGASNTSLQQNHTEDAMIKLMVSLAQQWGRNSTAAYSMVYGDKAFSATQAYRVHLITGVADTLSEAVSQLGLANEPVTTVSENPYEQFLSALSNSVVDGLLILIGELAIVIDLYHPTILLSVLGAFAIIAGLVGAEVIGASILGFFVLAVAAAIILLELKMGHGLAMIGGGLVGVAGIALLGEGLQYSSNGSQILSQIELVGVAVVVVVLGLYVRWVAGPIRSRKHVTGPESYIGAEGIVLKDLSPEGEVRVGGIVWHARAVSGTISSGSRVKVVKVEGLTFYVERAE
ncbi:MAG: NfeD family protein [Thermoprotei archaeon]